jgi:uncharacterized protein
MTTLEQNEKIIACLKPYQPQRIGIFGSFSRNENRADSDLDILVKFSIPVSLLKFIKIENDLSDVLQLKVDLVSEGALKNERLKQYIFNDLKIIYQ